MWPNTQIPAELVTFTEEVLTGKLYFLCRVNFAVKKNFPSSSFKIYQEFARKSKENLFERATLLMNATYIVFP